MGKRRVIESSDEYSDGEDASYQPKAKKPRANRPAANKRVKRAPTIDAANVDLDGAETETLVSARPHPQSLHVLSEPGPPRDALLGWYAGVHASRGMPWRKPYEESADADVRAQRAYEVWVSEVMLQQTQVATVIPYYNQWMARFPTVRDLAASDIDTVNGLWKGLGYYSRAARLLEGARKAVSEFKGRLPDNAKDMEANIPGIGRYSAGAICSIAYNERVPVLDGNVHRLLSRLMAIHAPPKAKQTLDLLWAAASAFVSDAVRPGDVNQGLIELGSTVCKVRDPSCGACPLQPWCAAYGEQYRKSPSTSTDAAVPDIEELCAICEPLPPGSGVTAFPMKAEKKKAREELDIVNVIEWRSAATAPNDERAFLLVRRPEGGLLAGLLEFPTQANVPVTTSPPEQIAIANAIVCALLGLEAPPPTRPTSSDPSRGRGRVAPGAPDREIAPEAAGNGCASPLRIAKVVPAGDVLHVFSHIRKTYRVQWVVLEGGAAPPPLHKIMAADGTDGAVAKSAGRPGRARSKNTASASTAAAASTQARWVPLAAVADANIGTGVSKIWRLVRALWPGDGSEEQE